MNEQHVDALEEDGVDREEITGENPGCLSAQKRDLWIAVPQWV